MSKTDPTLACEPTTKTPLHVHILAMTFVLLPCIAVSQWIAHWQVAVLDDHLFGYFGWRIYGGATLYLDVWDNKPPAIYWLNALGWLMGGGRYGGVVLLCTVAQVLSCVLFFVVAVSVYPRGAAAIATMLAGFYLTHGLFFAGGNRCETFLVPCELAAVALVVRGFQHGGWRRWTAAGACCGAACLFKQTGLAAPAAIMLHLIVLTLHREIAWRTALRRAGLLVGGLVAVVGVAAICLAARGALGQACFAVSTFNRLYLPPHEGYLLETWWWSRWFDRYALSALRVPLLMAFAAGVHACLWRVRPRFRPAEIEQRMHVPAGACPRTMTLFGLWFVMALAGAVASPRSAGHHFLPTVPPLLLMGGHLIAVLRTECGLLRRFAQRAWVLVAFLILAYLASDAVYSQFQKASTVWWNRHPRIERGRWTVDKTSWQRIGEQIARITRPDDRIQCWDYLPAVYLHARRPNACRFIMARYGNMLGPDGVRIDQTVLETLSADPPRIIVLRTDTYQALCGEGASTRDISAAGRWLGARYHRVKDITQGNLYVFMRNAGEPGDAGP